MSRIYLEADYFDRKENIYTFFTTAADPSAMHSHEFWELSYIYEGQGINLTTDDHVHVQVGDLLLIKPGTLHALGPDPDQSVSSLKVCNCLIRADYFSEIIQRLQTENILSGYSLLPSLTGHRPLCIRLCDDNAENLRHLLWLIAHEYNHFTDASSFLMENSLFSMMIILIRLYEYQSGHLTTPVSKRGDMDQLIKFILCNFNQHLTLELLAAQVPLSREYLSRAFKQQTGKSLSTFITEVRIQRAKEYLRTNTFSCAEIGNFCGYESASAFQKAFRKIVGMSPRDYRRMQIS